MSVEVFHVELRQSFHSARAFNLSEQELREQILSLWSTGGLLRWAERDWSPRKATLTIMASRELRPEEIAMGRGWQEAVRIGEEVTGQMLAAEQIARPEEVFKPQLLELCAEYPRALAELVRAAAAHSPHARFSEIVAVVEQTTWELLHEGAIELRLGEEASETVATERWRELLLAAGSWMPDAPLRLAISRAPPER